MAGNLAVAENRADGVLDPVAEVADLEALCDAGGEYAHEGKQDQGRPAPDDAVQRTVDLRNDIEHRISSLLL